MPVTYRQIALWEMDSIGMNTKLPVLTTFADESFSGTEARHFTIMADVSENTDLEWFRYLRKKLPKNIPEIKYSKLRRKWNRLDSNIQQVILNGIKDSLIVICDPNPIWQNIEKEIVEYIRARASSEFLFDSHPFREYITDWVCENMIIDLPLLKFAYHIPEINLEPEQLKYFLEHPNNIRIFVGRGISTYQELLDKGGYNKIIEKLFWNKRFFTLEHVSAELIKESHKSNHVFDEGNNISVKMLNSIRQQIDNILQKEYFFLPGEESVVIDLDSKLSPYLQIADISAGFAKEWYQGKSGLQKICNHFRKVVINGELGKKR